jgi:hypothetical protein
VKNRYLSHRGKGGIMSERGEGSIMETKKGGKQMVGIGKGIEAVMKKIAGYKHIDILLLCSVTAAFGTLLIISTIG